MLKRSFAHLTGVGAKKERELWDAGISSWQHFLDRGRDHFTPKKFDTLEKEMAQSFAALDRGDLGYFQKTLPKELVWRLVPGFEDDIAYLDIETTGLGGPPANHSTTIAILFRGELHLEHDHEKKRRLLKKINSEARVLCSYFGSVFDIPFLRKEFRLEFPQAHVDLCFWLRRLGYSGGLKLVQQRMPGVPQRDSQDIDGFDAVRLWHMHERGVKNALETLLSYNAEDTVVLPVLLAKAYELELKKSKIASMASDNFEAPALKLGAVPRIPYKVDPEVYRLLRGD